MEEHAARDVYSNSLALSLQMQASARVWGTKSASQTPRKHVNPSANDGLEKAKVRMGFRLGLACGARGAQGAALKRCK